MDGAPMWVHRGAVLLVGFAAAGVARFVGLLAALVFAFSCPLWIGIGGAVLVILVVVLLIGSL